uniref:NR LBD domain-containing protein n=1 Tax=Rhodnius prolixus TaxID=13249 RepID=T1HYE4_RHOPR
MLDFLLFFLAVRYGRVPKRSRERSSGEERVSTSDNSSSAATPPDPETALSPVYDLIVSVPQAHIANSDYSEENTRTLVRKPLPSPPSPVCAGPEVASSTAESLEQQRIWLWQQFATHVTPSVQRVVEFAKRVPGFCELSQDDQLILIKVGFFELWLSHASRLTTDTTLTFSDGTFVTRQQMELMYS